MIFLADKGKAVLKLDIWLRGLVRVDDAAVQLVLNVAWSWTFFRLKMPGWAWLELIVLWLAIALTTWTFFRRTSTAGGLMLPYLAWVTFAGALNFAICRVNA